MQPKLCSRCHKNVAVVFITKLDNNEPVNEGLCLKCARRARHQARAGHDGPYGHF